MDAAADGHVVPGLAVLGQAHREDRFAVGAHEFTEPVADARQRAAMLAVGQQAVGAQGAGRQHDATRREGLAALGEPGAGALGRDAVAVAAVGRAERHHVDHLVLGQDACAPLLGEPEVVLEQGVLGAHAAAHHAGPAAGAAGARRAFAPEVGVGDRAARLAEEHGAGRAGERLLGAEVPRHLAAQAVLGR